MYRTEDLDRIGLNKRKDEWRFASKGDFIVKGIEHDHCSRGSGKHFFMVEAKAEKREPGEDIKQYPPDVQQSIRQTLYIMKQTIPNKNYFIFFPDSGNSRVLSSPPPIC
jgi:hypothetical protein